MRIPLKIFAILIILTAAFAVIACNHMNSPESDSITSSENYTVIFDSQFSNDGSTTIMPDPTTKTVAPPATTIDKLPAPPTKSGYIFGGWYTGPNATGTNFTESFEVNAGNTVLGYMTVYAYWYKYMVTFKKDGEDYAFRGVAPPATTIVASLPATPTKTGNTFAGWFKSDGITEFMANTKVDADITIYAKWVINTTHVYSVTYDSDGGTAVGVQYVIVTPPATSNVAGPLPTEHPTKLFYAFDTTGGTTTGWWTQKDGGGTEFKAGTPVTADIIVYAQWTPTPGYTVTYNSGWGTSVDPQYVILSSGKTVATGTTEGSLPTPPPTKPCYHFAGWYTDKTNATPFTASTDVTSIADPDTKILTVYAKWTEAFTFPTGPFKKGDPGPSCVGKVFYIDGGGDSGPHGLEMAPPGWYDKYADNADPALAWISGDPVTDDEGNVTQQTQTTLNGNTSTAIGTGLANSNAIITQSRTPLTASSFSPAELCEDYHGGGLSGWFLPSKDELAQLYAQRDTTRWGGFDADFYWSSSEYDKWNAWSQSFINGTQNGSLKSYERRIRPVRAF